MVKRPVRNGEAAVRFCPGPFISFFYGFTFNSLFCSRDYPGFFLYSWHQICYERESFPFSAYLFSNSGCEHACAL